MNWDERGGKGGRTETHRARCIPYAGRCVSVRWMLGHAGSWLRPGSPLRAVTATTDPRSGGEVERDASSNEHTQTKDECGGERRGTHTALDERSANEADGDYTATKLTEGRGRGERQCRFSRGADGM
ncbi:hypothetical protein AB1N83_013962 [Pleurotus pulmonarius]